MTPLGAMWTDNYSTAPAMDTLVPSTSRSTSLIATGSPAFTPVLTSTRSPMRSPIVSSRAARRPPATTNTRLTPYLYLQRFERQREHPIDLAALDVDTGEAARLEERIVVRDQGLEGERPRAGVDGRTDAGNLARDRLVGIGVDLQLNRLADLDPWHHALRNLGRHLQRVDAHNAHHRRLRLDVLAERDETLLNVALERGANAAVAQLTLGQPHAGLRCVDVCPQVRGVLQGGSAPGLPGAQGGVGVVECLIDPLRTTAHLALAKVYALEGKTDLARKHAEVAAEPEPAAGNEALAQLLMDRGDVARAADYARRSVAADPERIMSRFILGVAAQRAGPIRGSAPRVPRRPTRRSAASGGWW